MSNRVEDLERQVAELQAAVNGLTEELVEMKERVRQLEEAEDATDAADGTDAQPAAAPVQDDAEPESAERTTHSDDHADVVERTGEDGSDIVVPEEEATTPDAEAAKAEREGEGSEDGESGDSDIIVA